MDGKVWVGCSCKRGCYHGDEDRDYNQTSDNPQNTEHATKGRLGGAIAITVKKGYQDCQDCYKLPRQIART